MGKVTIGPSDNNSQISDNKSVETIIKEVIVEKIVHIDRPVEVIVEKEIITIQEKIVEIPVEVIVDRPVEVIVKEIEYIDRPVEVIVEKQVVKYNNVVDIQSILEQKQIVAKLEKQLFKYKIALGCCVIVAIMLGVL